MINPHDEITWFKAKGGGYKNGSVLIQAQAWYKVGTKWAIRFKNRVGEVCIRYVPEEQIEKGHRPGALQTWAPH